MQKYHFTRYLPGEPHLVGYQKHSTPLFRQRADHVQYFLHHLGIEGGGRLVEQDHAWLHGQCAGNRCALLLTTGKLCRESVALVGDPHLLKKGLSRLNGLGLGLAQHTARRLDNVVEDAHVRPEIEVLKDKTDAGTQSVDLAVVCGNQIALPTALELELFASDQDLPLMGVLQQIDAAQHGALAGPGRAENRDNVAVAGDQINALENLKVAVTFVQVAHFQSG